MAAQEEVYRKQVRAAYQLFMYDYFSKNRDAPIFTGTFSDIVDHLRNTIGNPRIDVKEMLVRTVPSYKDYADTDRVPIQRPAKLKFGEKK